MNIVVIYPENVVSACRGQTAVSSMTKLTSVTKLDLSIYIIHTIFSCCYTFNTELTIILKEMTVCSEVKHFLICF